MPLQLQTNLFVHAHEGQSAKLTQGPSGMLSLYNCIYRTARETFVSGFVSQIESIHQAAAGRIGCCGEPGLLLLDNSYEMGQSSMIHRVCLVEKAGSIDQNACQIALKIPSLVPYVSMVG